MRGDGYYSCVSHDGTNFTNKIQVWQCPKCFRTITAPAIRIYEPNKTCTCEFPNTVYIMDDLGIRCPVGYKEINE